MRRTKKLRKEMREQFECNRKNCPNNYLTPDNEDRIDRDVMES